MTNTAEPLLAFFCTTNDPEDSKIIFAKSNVEARRHYTNAEGFDFGGVSVTRKPLFDQYAPGPVPAKALLEDGWWFECWGCGCEINLSNDDAWINNCTQKDLEEIARNNAEVDADLAEFDRRQAEPLPPLPEDPIERRYEEDRRKTEPRRVRNFIEMRRISPLLDWNALRFVGTRAVFCSANCELTHHEHKARINLAHERAEVRAAELFPEGQDFKSSRYPMLEPHVQFTVPGLKYPVHWSPSDGENVARVTNHDAEAWQKLMAQRKKENTDGAREEVTGG